MRFIALFLCFSALLASGLVAANFVIDPYGVWKNSLFVPTQYRGITNRVYHPMRVLTEDYDYVLIGSSRTREGYLLRRTNMDVSSYNAAFSGATGYEAAKFMSLIAKKPSPPKHVVFGVDFFGFAPDLRLRPSAEESPLNDKPLWQIKLSTLFGHKHLRATVKSLKNNLKGKAKPPPFEFPGYISGNHKERMKAGLKSHAEVHLSNFDPNTPEPDKEIMQAVMAGISDLAGKGVNVTLIINPVHASRMRLIEKLGLQEHYEALMQELSAITYNVNNKNPGFVEFWDFAECKSVLLENVPDEKSKKMTYFYDSNHFTPLFGNDIAKQTFLRDQYPDYRPIYTGKKLAPSLTLISFSRNWSACNSNIDHIVRETVEHTAAQRCKNNIQWCRH